MDEAASATPRRRKVKCPRCQGILAEPGSPIYECPFCFILLLAKGTPSNFLADAPTKSTTDNDQGPNSSPQTHGLEASSNGGNVVPTRKQSQGQVIDPCETDASGDGIMKVPEQLLAPIENGSVENTPESELQRETDAGRDKSAATGNTDMLVLADCASNTGTATADEGMAAGVLRLISGGGKEEASASSGGEESPEEHLLSDHMNLQCNLSSGDDKLTLQLPSDDAEEHLLSGHMNEQCAFSGGEDGKPTSQLPLEDAENRCKPNGIEEDGESVGDCESMEGKDHNPEIGEGAKDISQSEIFRDIDNDLSFKYISSALESTNRPPSRKRSSRLRKRSSETLGRISTMPDQLTDESPSRGSENPEDDESYSSTSESSDSHESVESEFDFPSPSAGSMKPAHVSDLLFQQQIPSPDVSSDVLAAPHKLEWEGAGLEDEEIPPQKSISATVVSIGAVNGDACGVLIGIEGGDRVESADGDWHQQKSSSLNGTLSVELRDTAGVPVKTLQAQTEDGVLGIGGLANPVGLAHLNGERGEETKRDSGSLLYQVNGHRSVSYTDLGEEVPHSLLAGAEHPSQRGDNTSSTLVLGTEAACTLPVSDVCNEQTCRASPEMIKLTNSVANIQQVGDSITHIARKNTIIIGGSDHSENAAQMISTKKISERASDALYHHQNQFLQDADNHRRPASMADFATQRAAEKGYLAQNNEAEYMAMPSVSELRHPSNRSIINNFDARLQLKRNYAVETTRGRNSKGTVADMFDSRLLHKSNHPSEETYVQSERSLMYASKVPPKSVHYRDHHVSRSRSSDGSSNTHHTHGQAALTSADGQWSWSQKPNVMEHGPFLTNVSGIPPAATAQQPFGYNECSNGPDFFASGVSFPYQQVPSHSCPVPVAMPGHGFIHCGCHSVAPVCMACIHAHHSDLPQLSMPPPHGYCCNQELPITLRHGPCNIHQAHQIQPSDQGASVARHPSAYLPSQTVRMRDSVMAMEKRLVSSARKSKPYPPMPRGIAAPYVICKSCEEILKVPTDVPFSDSATQKLRCGSCGKVSKFSTLKGNHGAGNNVALQLRKILASSAKASHLVQHPEVYSRPLPVSKVIQTMEPSHHQDLYPGVLPLYKQGSFDSQQQFSAAIKTKSRPSSLDEIVPAKECEGATTDHDSQDEFFFRSLSRQYCEFDSSRMFFNGFEAASFPLGACDYHDEVSIVSNGVSLQAPVDEKDEGLDFGAPRMSDGESPDQRSPDSRIRLPEHVQHIQSCDQNQRMQNSHGDDETGQNTENVMLELKKRSIALGKKPTQTLLALLNQSSSKFQINMEKRISFDECRSAICSTASSSPVHDHLANETPDAGGKSIPQSSKLTSTSVVRKGPSYVANMLRRSVKHFHRESQ